MTGQPTGSSDPAAPNWDAIRLAFVDAGMPLEALILSGTYKTLSPDVQAAVIKGAQSVRRMLKELT